MSTIPAKDLDRLFKNPYDEIAALKAENWQLSERCKNRGALLTETNAMRDAALDEVDAWATAALKHYPPNWAFDATNPELVVANIARAAEARAEKAEQQLAEQKERSRVGRLRAMQARGRLRKALIDVMEAWKRDSPGLPEYSAPEWRQAKEALDPRDAPAEPDEGAQLRAQLAAEKEASRSVQAYNEEIIRQLRVALTDAKDRIPELEQAEDEPQPVNPYAHCEELLAELEHLRKENKNWEALQGVFDITYDKNRLLRRQLAEADDAIKMVQDQLAASEEALAQIQQENAALREESASLRDQAAQAAYHLRRAAPDETGYIATLGGIAFATADRIAVLRADLNNAEDLIARAFTQLHVAFPDSPNDPTHLVGLAIHARDEINSLRQEHEFIQTVNAAAFECLRRAIPLPCATVSIAGLAHLAEQRIAELEAGKDTSTLNLISENFSLRMLRRGLEDDLKELRRKLERAEYYWAQAEKQLEQPKEAA